MPEMKSLKTKILITTFSLFTFCVRAQMDFDVISERIIYESVVHVDSVPASQLYDRAKEWMVRNLKSADNNNNLSDKESGSLTSTGNIKLEDRSNFGCRFTDFNLNFKLSVFVKEGRYKYIIENFYHSYLRQCSGSTYVKATTTPESGPFEKLDFTKNKNEKIYNEANGKVVSMIAELEKAMKTTTVKKRDDW